jgi:hypothetical protein
VEVVQAQTLRLTAEGLVAALVAKTRQPSPRARQGQAVKETQAVIARLVVTLFRTGQEAVVEEQGRLGRMGPTPAQDVRGEG